MRRSILDAHEFRLEDDDSHRLLSTLKSAYRSRPQILGLLLRTPINETDVDTDGAVQEIWIAVLRHAAQKGLLRELVVAATRDPGSVNHHGPLNELLAEGQPVAAPVVDVALLDQADALLSGVVQTRAPIVIALETDDAELEETELERTACHLIVTLTGEQVADLVSTARGALREARSVADLVAAGQSVWRKLCTAESRLTALHARIAGGGLAQPVGWCARPDLLEPLAVALQVAHTGGSGHRGFLSVGAGGHYLSPIHSVDKRTIKYRADTTSPAPAVGRVDLRTARPDCVRTKLEQVNTEVVVAVHGANTAAVAELGEVVRNEVARPTRAMITFGGPVDVAKVDALLTVVPFVSCGAATLADDETLDVLTTIIERYSQHVAMPCITAAVRAGLVARALEQDDIAACQRVLTWHMWSWIGRPLFSRSFSEIEGALYPHLMDLRSIATREWYFDRRERIAQDYQASALVRPSEPFHLYLSGAGGTGKSCFLRHVYDELCDQDGCLPVWYRVDAPSSEWHELAGRLREETVRAVADRFGVRLAQAIEQLKGDLGDFLGKAAALLHDRVSGFVEIAVFVDQLERTFESGDAPDAVRLDDISKQVVGMLEDVGADMGVRVFIASRKQYLPDFLVSSRAAASCRLEFNVLQTISDEKERIAFVQQVVRWCSKQELIGRNVTLRDDAALTLVRNVDGNPLNMMLALIQLLAHTFSGAITEDDVKQRKPWNRLFQLDLAAAKRDELDLYFLLAMSHARAEIVRFEEVWWRIRMVTPELTRRVDDLGRDGIRERLWLLGFLGRTIHARPSGNEPMRYVEFFHANLRDFLLREEMGPGGGTPQAWRALDRLAQFSRDWAQTLQPLLAEEIWALMEHRDEVIATGLVPDEDAAPAFHLLFLRDPTEARPVLSVAARACFAYSALVHDEGGRWAVEALFPDIKERVGLIRDWLERSPVELLPPILRYLIPLEVAPARELVVSILLDSAAMRGEDIARATALVLTEPLYAARWRNEVLLAILTVALRQVGGDPNKLSEPVVGLVVAACDRDRDALLALIAWCRDRLEISEDANLRTLAPRLVAFDGLDRWLGETASGPLLRGATLANNPSSPAAPLGLVLGEALRDVVTADTLADWSDGVRAGVGMPLPDLAFATGEVEPYEAELRFSGQRVARNLFRPGARRVVKRLWEQLGGPRAAIAEDLQSDEEVLWLPPEIVEATAYRHEHLDVDEAITRWIVDHCRREFVQLFDADLQVAFLREVAATQAGRECLRRTGSRLIRAVFVDLIEEAVPIPSRDEVLEQLTDVTPRIEIRQAGRQITREAASQKLRETATQKIREYLQSEICRSIADDFGQVTTILLDEELERTLVDRIDQHKPLQPGEAIRLDAAIQRLAIHARERSGPPPAIVTVPRLRRILALLLQQLDHRLPVLSFTEWDEAFISVPGGLVAFALDAGDKS